MIVNEKDKYLIDYYPINKNIVDENETLEIICQNILNDFNTHPKELNNLYDLNKWDEYKDNILKQLVLFYNFDFQKISNVFDKLCKIKRDLNSDGEEIPVYTEKILRYHWSFIHARRLFGKSTGEDYYILNRNENENENENNIKLNDDKNQEKENSKKEIGADKSLVNTVNVTSLNKENDLNIYFDKLLNQEMDKERTKLLEMELKENEKKQNLFPIKIDKNNQEKNVDEIINDIKQQKLEKEKEKEILQKQKEEEEME